MSREQRTRAKDEAGKIIVEEINNFLDASRSPVSGGNFKVKKQDGTRSILFEFGDMRDAIEFKRRKGNKIEVGIFDRSQTPKAFNHNIGDTVPERQFIPGEDENFKGKINRRVNAAIESIKREDAEPRRFIGDTLETFEIDIGLGEVTTEQTTLGAIITSVFGDDL